MVFTGNREKKHNSGSGVGVGLGKGARLLAALLLGIMWVELGSSELNRVLEQKVPLRYFLEISRGSTSLRLYTNLGRIIYFLHFWNFTRILPEWYGILPEWHQILPEWSYVSKAPRPANNTRKLYKGAVIFNPGYQGGRFLTGV